jgi:hypothetical protein
MDEILIQIRPGNKADIVEYFLKKSGFRITGSGSLTTQDAPRHLWVIPPPEAHIDEFKFIPDGGPTPNGGPPSEG